MHRRQLAAVVLSALFAVAAQPALAAWEATPFVGAMVPTKSLLIDTAGGSYFRMTTHTVYGFALSTEMTDKAGIELVFGTGSGKMEVLGGSTVLELSSTMYMADLRGRLRLMGSDQSSFSGVLGAGYTDFSLGLFDYADETGLGTFMGRLTGVVGGEFHNRLSDRVNLNVTIVDRIHVQGVGLTSTFTEVSEKTQNDITATAGLTFGL